MTISFADLGVPSTMVEALERRGITAPFPIQTATLADALAGRDLCGRAPTGSGKTLAFAIPLAARTGRGAPHRPRGLVLVPTRELATQVAEEVRPLAQARGRSVATFFGGTNIARDQRCLRRGVDLVIACPGRLADLVRRRDVDLSDVDLVVLDEADRMADMGFLPEVKRLLDRTSPGRQTLLFSATLDGDVDVLVRRYQRTPVRHSLNGTAETTGDVRHLFWHAQSSDRLPFTRQLMGAVESGIVFTRTKHSADRVAKQLNRGGVRSAAIHSNRSQSQRQRALEDFAEGRVTALVATDIAARGIHVDNVGVVVHYDPPATDKDYVHRSGRTGRAGTDGLVVTLVAPDKVGDVSKIQRALDLRQHIGSFALEELATGGTVRAGQLSEAPAPRQRPAAGSRTAAGRRPSHRHGASGRRRKAGL